MFVTPRSEVAPFVEGLDCGPENGMCSSMLVAVELLRARSQNNLRKVVDTSPITLDILSAY